MRLYFGLITAGVLIFSLPARAEQHEYSRHFASSNGGLTPAKSGNAEEIARQYLLDSASSLALSPADLAGIYVARSYRSANNGVTHVLFRQRFQGADVFNAEWVVNLDQDNRILNAGGSLFPAPEAVRKAPQRVRASAAARAAISAVNTRAGAAFAPFESSEAPRGRNTVRYSRGPLPLDVEGRAGWYFSRGKLRPAWNFFVADTDQVHRHSVTVDDLSQAILDNQPLTYFQSAPAVPRGLVYDQGSPQPNTTPGVRLSSAPPVVQRVLKSFKGDPIASPLGWTDGTVTAGNNVVAGENLAATPFIRPIPTVSADGDFSFPLQLGSGYQPLAFPDAATTNLFYWMNLAHDLHYQYGFDEQAGNFQANNFNRGGVGGDPLYAYAHYGAQSVGSGQFENAFFSVRTADDGDQPEVAMFVSGAVGALGDFFTDGSLDASVMVHEYTHGVSNRLVRQVYTNFQGRSMGEAWSDFYGLEYTLPEGGPTDGVYPMSEYFDQTWGYGGGRTRPYSTNPDVNPITFADIGHIWYKPEVHSDGEIWFEALWEVRANLIKQFGEKEGRKRARQLVMDGMKLSIPAPTMIDMRDAILLADRIDYKGASQTQIWTGFAKRGMGALAYSDGPDTTHVAASFEMPSTTGAIRFYDSNIVMGEPVRIILQDSNYTQPTVRIQLTGSSGDLEDMLLHQHGSIYVGSITTANSTVAKQNTRLELVAGDFISAYYVDQDAGGSGKLVQATIPAMLPYSVTVLPNSFTFSRETRYIPTGGYNLFTLPFEFPFYDRKVSQIILRPDGMLYLEQPWDSSPCADATALKQYAAITPMWFPFNMSGTAQPNEAYYVSNTSDSMTFRWAGEYTPLGQTPVPVNIAATLFSDGRIQFFYGPGNTVFQGPYSTTTECAPSFPGLSNGHYTYTQSTFLPTYQNGSTLLFEPPFNKSSLPTATIQLPAAGGHVQDVLTVSGTAGDSQTSIRSVDLFVDGVQRSRAVPSGAQLAWSVTLDTGALGLAPGNHTLWVRVTNARGGFTDVPSTPMPFVVDPGKSSTPVAVIESPADGATVKGSISITGYAYDPALRILSVDTVIDGFVYPGTTYGVTRTDICNPLQVKPFNCPTVGFTARISSLEAAPPLPDGPHKLQIRVRDQFGRFTFYPASPVNITVSNGAAVPVLGTLESPVANAILTGTATVTGYVYSPGRKVTSAVLVVDDISYSSTTPSLARADVCESLPKADACPNIGFRFTLNTKQLRNGPHRLGIRAVNDRGDVVTFPAAVDGGINVSVQNP